MPPHKRQLRNYLLDRKLQLRFTVAIVLIAAVLTTGLGYFWYGEMRKASRIVEVKALATMSDAEVKKVEADLRQQDLIRLGILAGFGIVIAVVLAGFSIIFTHKVAGPLFKISRHLKDVQNNNLKEMWDLRKGDQLLVFWEGFKAAHTALRLRQQSDIATIEAVLEATPEPASDEQKQALAALTELRDTKKASLDGSIAVDPTQA